MDQMRKMALAREWIIFALSIGIGGHVAFGLVLHDPLQQRWQEIGWNILFIGLFVYIIVQAGRSLFTAIRARQTRRDA